MSGGVTRPRPAWVPEDLYPFADRYADVAGCVVHYVDEGSGPPLLLLHGNPTWSFLYRKIIVGLRDRHRCVAVDYPGFGLSSARPGYGFTPAEHADVVAELVRRLDLRGVTMMVQDWGGPIGFAVATRYPERFQAFVIGNTWAWPKADLPTRLFSGILGGPVGRRLILNRNLFVEGALGQGVRPPLPPRRWRPTAAPSRLRARAGRRPSSRARSSPAGRSSPRSSGACPR